MLKISNHHVILLLLISILTVAEAYGTPLATGADFTNADGINPVDTGTVPSAPQGNFGTSSETVFPEEVPSQAQENTPIAEQSQEPTWPSYEIPKQTETPVSPASGIGGNAYKNTTQTDIPSRSKQTEGVLQLFRSFSGDRTVKNLADLFKKFHQAGIVQHPAIAVSDGVTPFVVRVDSSIAGVTPSFSFRGAHLETLHQISDGTWELQAIPQKNKCVIYLSVKNDTEVLDIPLTVIPPNLQGAEEIITSSESHVSELLAATNAKEGRVVYDLNRDGMQDYLDDYILIGYYLLNLATPLP